MSGLDEALRARIEEIARMAQPERCKYEPTTIETVIEVATRAVLEERARSQAEIDALRAEIRDCRCDLLSESSAHDHQKARAESAERKVEQLQKIEAAARNLRIQQKEYDRIDKMQDGWEGGGDRRGNFLEWLSGLETRLDAALAEREGK